MLSLVYAFYDNAEMLATQYAVWASYPEDLKSQIEIILVDDGSFAAASVARPGGLPLIRLFEIQDDIPWNQDGARNIGAHEAANHWLLLCDMDHVVPASTLRAVLARIPKLDPWDVGNFSRVRVTGQPLSPAPNILLINREVFWDIGGYDERLRGYYGTDIPFRKRMYASCRKVGLNLPVTVYQPSDIPDCSTRGLSRSVDNLPTLDDQYQTMLSDYREVIL